MALFEAGWSWPEIERAINTHFNDEQIASQVASMRKLGRKIGQEKEYEKRIARLLRERGYNDKGR